MLLILTVTMHGLFCILLKGKKKFMRITNAFQNFLGKVGCKPNNIWVDHGSEFYNGSLKQWLHGICVKLYYTFMYYNVL